MASKIEILEATIDVFNEKGLKFTMDDLAKRLSISKKTIYQCFRDKNSLFLEMTDYLFDQIKIGEREVYDDPELSDLEKFQRILIVLPDRFRDIDFTKLRALQHEYPEIYSKIADRLDSGWELTIELYERALAKGEVREVDMDIFKAVFEGAIFQLLSDTEMNAIAYRKALDKVLDLMMMGVITHG